MQLINTGDRKLLIHQISIYFLAVWSFSCMVAGSIYGIPYQDASKDAEWDLEWSDPLCNNETANMSKDECNCSVQFLWNPWGSLMHAFLFFLMTLTTGYLTANTFRTGREANLFASPPVFSLYTSAAMNLSFVFYFAWIFTWNSQDWIGATIVIFIAAGAAWAGLVIFSFSIANKLEELNHYTPVDRWIYVILVQNTLALAATWFLCVFFVNFAMAMHYTGSPSEPGASEAMIIMLTFIIAICTPLDLMLCDQIFRYVISPLFVILWSLSSIYDRLKDDNCHDGTVRVYAVVLLTIVIFILVGKILLSAWRHLQKPLAMTT